MIDGELDQSVSYISPTVDQIDQSLCALPGRVFLFWSRLFYGHTERERERDVINTAQAFVFSVSFSAVIEFPDVI